MSRDTDRPGLDGRVPHSKDTDERGTPEWLIRLLTANGLFDLDGAAGAEPRPIAKTRYTKADNGLTSPWATVDIDSIYLNPPFSNITPFLEKLVQAVDPSRPDHADYAVALTKTDASTDWFHDFVTESRYIVFPDDRICFHGAGDKPDFAVLLALFGDPPEELVERLGTLGAVYTPAEVTDADGEQLTFSKLSPADQDTDETTLPGRELSQLEAISLTDTVYLQVTSSPFQAESAVPNAVELTPISREDGPTDSDTVIDAVGITKDGDDICARFRNPSNSPVDIEVSVAVGTGRWQVVTPKSVTVKTPTSSAIPESQTHA